MGVSSRLEQRSLGHRTGSSSATECVVAFGKSKAQGLFAQL